MNHCCTLQRQAGTLFAHLASRLLSQLCVDQRHQLIERGLVALAPRVEQARDVNGIGLGHGGHCSSLARFPRTPEKAFVRGTVVLSLLFRRGGAGSLPPVAGREEAGPSDLRFCAQQVE